MEYNEMLASKCETIQEINRAVYEVIQRWEHETA
jgi:hypothetical protein